MAQSERLIEVWRGEFLECFHSGHAVVVDTSGQMVDAWGDPEKILLPRSSCKMIQALPLVESGAADAIGLTPQHLALACSSHQSESYHLAMVEAWLSEIGLDDTALRCGTVLPHDLETRKTLNKTDTSPCQIHNECSGKHTGFLTLARHLDAGPEYIDVHHPVQRACLEALERMTGVVSPGHAIDGCAAPNFATTLTGLARAMAMFAGAAETSAAGRLRDAMRRHPQFVAGTGKATTELMQAMDGHAAIKTGAEGVFTAILPEEGLGIAIKIDDGASRASAAACAALLIKYGALNPVHPLSLCTLNGPILNRRGMPTGKINAAPGFG